MKLNKFLTKSLAAVVAAICALTPVSAMAAETTTKYNPEVTTANGNLKLGWNATDDDSETWWKSEFSFSDWKAATEAEFNAEKDNDLKMMDATGRTGWRTADKATYDEYLKNGGSDLARKNGTTAWRTVDKATWESWSNEANKKSVFGDWTEADKAAYDAVTDANAKKCTVSDWKTFADATNWAAKYDEWAKYPSDMRKFTGSTDFREVSLDEYTAFAAKFPGNENVLYKYEDISHPETYLNWVYFNEQIIANELDASNSHNPGFVLVGSVSNVGSGIEGGTWDGKNDGIRYFNNDNGVCAQYVAETALAALNEKGIAYTTINSGSDIPKVFAQKSKDVHNETVFVADKDFGIYYYAGSDTIEVQELFGILIAPNATVKIGGKWCGTIIADKVLSASNWTESTMWCYPEGKGTVERKYYVCDPSLEVKDILYFVRTAEYQVRDDIYEVRDVVKKYFVRNLVEKKYYCKKSPYVPETGDSLVMLYVLCGVAVAGVVLVTVSRKKKDSAE